MPIQRKQKVYRKKKLESDDGEAAVEQTNGVGDDVSDTIEELQELRKLRRKHGGIDAEKLFKGDDKRKKKKATPEHDPWKLKTGGLVDRDAVRAGISRDDEKSTERTLKLDTFTTQTNALDVDKHMMAYIEAEMRRRRGEPVKDEEEDESERQRRPLDIYEELYRIPDRLKVEQKPVEEGSVQLSTQMLTAIPEVDLGIDVRLKNIEDTERAKRKYMDEQEKDDAKADDSQDDFDVPANFEKQIQKPEHRSRMDKRQTASDEVVAERFKKRMRK